MCRLEEVSSSSLRPCAPQHERLSRPLPSTAPSSARLEGVEIVVLIPCEETHLPRDPHIAAGAPPSTLDAEPSPGHLTDRAVPHFGMRVRQAPISEYR